MLHTDLRDQLAQVARGGDRSPPLAFVGREHELSHLQGLVDVAQHVHGLAGAVRIVDGAPGMGKTGLCDEFERRIFQAQDHAGGEGADGGSAPPVACVHLSPYALAEAPGSLVQRIDQQIRAPQLNPSQSPWLHSAAEAVARRVLRDAGAQSAPRLHNGSSMGFCLDAYAQHVWTPGSVVAVLIDEAQNFLVDDDRTKGNLHEFYHVDRAVRMPMFLFGLPDTTSVLRRLGLSRITDGAGLSLGCLNPGEGLEVLESAFDAMGLNAPYSSHWERHLQDKGVTADAWVNWCAKLVQQLEVAAQDFPQHLAAGLAAACQGLLATEKPMVTFNERLLADIGKSHAKRRVGYCKGSLARAKAEPHALALGALCGLFTRRQGASVDRDEARQLILAGWLAQTRLPPIDPSDVLERVACNGVLGCKWDMRESPLTPPPVPPMQQYLMDGFEAALAQGRRTAMVLNAALNQLEPPPSASEKHVMPGADGMPSGVAPN